MKNNIVLGLVLIGVLVSMGTLMNNAEAVSVFGATGEYVEGSFDYNLATATEADYGQFFVNKTGWENNFYFYYDSPNTKLHYTVKFPSVDIGSYTVPIFVNYAYNVTSGPDNDTYAIGTKKVIDVAVSVTSVSHEMREAVLPNSGLLERGNELSSSAGFIIILKEIGPDSVIIDTINCNVSGVQIDYSKNKTFKCGDCNVEIEPVFQFKDSTETQFAKLEMFTNCYAYSISLNDGGYGSSSSGKCTKIMIQPTGTATRGQNLLLSTRDQNGKSITANILITDSSPYTEDQAIVTDSPWSGLGKVLISKAAIPPVTILARSEEFDCEGTYTITTLEGQLITPESEHAINHSLAIRGLPGEALINTFVNGTVYCPEDGEILTVKSKIVRIKDPNNVVLKASTNENGMFSIYTGIIGNYVIISSFPGYKDSINYTVKIRHPRKHITVQMLRNGQPITSVNQGEIIDVAIYSDGLLVKNLTATGTISIGNYQSPLDIVGGMVENLRIEQSGNIKIVIPQTEEYKAGEFNGEVFPFFDFTFGGLLWWVLGVIFLIFVVVFIFKRRGNRGSDVLYGTPAGEEELVK